MRRGSSLIELMIVVAIMGIAAITVGGAAQKQRLEGQEVLQRARAELLLAYSAERIAAGQRGEEAVMARLMEGLPRASVQEAGSGPTRDVKVAWGPRDALHQRIAVVFVGKK